MEEHSLASNPVKPVISCAEVARCPSRSRRTTFAPSSPRSRIPWIMPWRCSCCAVACASVKSPTFRLDDIDWTQQSVRINQGKGRKDRLVYLSADALAALRTCLTARPTVVPEGLVFWNQKRPHRTLSAKGIQKKIERYAKAAGIKASCHSLRHTFASNLLEAGAEVISIKELLGHASIKSSERYAKLSNQRVKQVYQQTMRKVIAKTRV